MSFNFSSRNRTLSILKFDINLCLDFYYGFTIKTIIKGCLEDLTNQITLYGALGGNENIEEKIEERNF